MLTNIFKKKIILISATLFAIGLLYLIPREETINTTKEVEYIDNTPKSVIYLLNDNNYLSRTMITISNNDINIKAKDLLEILIKDGIGEDKIKNGFKSIIPSDTKINSISYENNLIKVDFSKELLNVKKEYEEKIIEAIIYTLTSINGIEQVIIYVDGEILTKLPQTGINLPSTLDRSYGINKEVNIDNYKNVNKVTIYYGAKNNNELYYIPVTKYVNDNREKIKIIIDELASSYMYNSNLISFLSNNVKLLQTEKELDVLFLVFNEYIFGDMNTKSILEEVMYMINLSVMDNYDVKEVIYKVNDEEIYKTELKVLEN